MQKPVTLTSSHTTMPTRWFKCEVPIQFYRDACAAVAAATPKLSGDALHKAQVQSALSLKGSSTQLDKVSSWKAYERDNYLVVEYARKITFKEIEKRVTAHQQPKGR